MPRLPIPGSDEFKWGDILNEYLSIGHNPDGTHKTIPVSQGGTGATDTASARTNLDVFSKSEVTTQLNAHITDTTAAHAASSISFTPAGTIAASTVQAAIEEVAAEAGAGVTLGNTAGADLASSASAGTASTAARSDHVHSFTGLATDAELTAHNNATTSVHGIADTSVLETVTGSQAKVNAHVAAADPHTQYLTNARHDALDHTTALNSAVLADLGDVAATSATDGQFLVFDTTNGWQPETVNFSADHGTLTGLSDDDHPQYLLTSGNRTTTGVTLTANAAGTTPFTVTANASPSADIMQIKAGSNNKIRIDSSGGFLTLAGNISVRNAGDTATTLNIAGSDGAMTWASDTNLYRASANHLKTDDQFSSAVNVLAHASGAAQMIMGQAGPSNEAGIILGQAGDTNLYRSASSTLKTDDTFQAALNIYAQHGQGSQVLLGNVGPSSQAAIELGGDSTIYRSAANTLRTDEAMVFGSTVTLAANPTQNLEAATKQYVDSVATGLDPKQSVRAATTANITLSGTQTIDGVALVAGDRVLVKDQTTQSENGIYVVASGAWTRSSDADSSAEVTAGMYVFVEEGSAQTDTGWVLTTNGTITLGTTALTFIRFSSTNDHGNLGGLSDDDHPQYLLTSGSRTTTGVTLNATSALDVLTISNTASRANINMFRNQTLANGNEVASIMMRGGDAAGNSTNYVQVYSKATTATDGSEKGELNVALAHNGSITDGFKFTWNGGDSAQPQILFGTSGDVNLYRSAANELKTDDGFVVGGGDVLVTSATGGFKTAGGGSANTAFATNQGGSQYKFQILQDGKLQWGDGTSAVDTNLYRSQANVLKTDHTFHAASNIAAQGGLTNQTVIGAVGPASQSAIVFGSANDTNLYRSAADTLRTDDTFIAGGTSGRTEIHNNRIEKYWASESEVRFSLGQDVGGSGKAGILMGSGAAAPDTNLYRDGANTLKTDDNLVVAGTLSVGGATLPSDDVIVFGSEGVLTVRTGKGRFKFPFAAVLLGVSAAVDTASTGSAIILDVNKNGTTMFTTQGNRPTINANTNSTAAEVTNMDVTAIASGDYLTVDIDQVGSTVAGADLTVTVRFKRA